MQQNTKYEKKNQSTFLNPQKWQNKLINNLIFKTYEIPYAKHYHVKKNIQLEKKAVDILT